MRTHILFLLFFCSNVLMYSQTTLNIREKHYEGIIFSSQCNVFGFPPTTNRFTPSEDDIINAEKILLLSFQKVTDKSREVHSKKDVISKKKLKKYYRLYWGELNNDDDKIIGIVLDAEPCRFKYISSSEGIYSVNDGGATYFIVFVNITSNSLVSIKLNDYG